MSLVNDMLRDLDARRRDAPARGIGAEKLVPASEQSTEPGKRQKPVWPWLTLSALLAITVCVVIYFLFVRGSGQLPDVVLTQPVVPTAQSAATERTATANTNAGLDEAVGIELAEMSERMRELEAQNQALLRAQQTQSPSQNAAAQSGSTGSEEGSWQPREWTPQADADAAQAAVTTGQAAAPESAGTDTARTETAGTEATAAAQVAAADNSPAAPARATGELPAGQLQQQQQTALAQESAATTVRSPRDLSFADTDRLRVQQALQQWSGGQQLAALQALDTFTYEYPEAHQSREMLAKLLIQQGEPERAMQVVDLGLTIAPRRSGYKKVKARLLLNQGQAAEAVALLSSNRPAVPDDVEYHDLLATGLLSSAMYEEAAIAYRSLLETDELPGRWWYGMAASLDAQGHFRNAAQAYEEALGREDLSASLRQGSQQRLQAIRLMLP